MSKTRFTIRKNRPSILCIVVSGKKILYKEPISNRPSVHKSMEYNLKKQYQNYLKQK